MTLLLPIKILDAEKLEVLRRLDHHRQWHSVDEKRYCIVCSNIITGREVHVVGGPPGTAELRLACPTENCRSIPMDWILPPDEIVATMSMLQAEISHAGDSATLSHTSSSGVS